MLSWYLRSTGYVAGGLHHPHSRSFLLAERPAPTIKHGLPNDPSTVLHAPPTSAQCARPFHLRSSNALVTTLTLENAIAAPAITGFSQPSAASGTPTRL